MKRLILMLGTLVCLLAAVAVFAQQGVITYESRINVHRTVPENMKAMMPEFRVSKMQLSFNAEESLYKPIKEDEEEQSFSPSPGVRMTMVRNPINEVYVNTTEAMVLKFRELMGKKYIITDSIQVLPWKFGTETKEIMGYTCRMAYYTNTREIQVMTFSNGASTPQKSTVTEEITAWYTDQIRPSLGPDEYNSLPGTVLAVDVNNGERVLVARNIELRDLKKNELVKPESGTKVTQAEFQKIQSEQMEKMRANGRTFSIGH